MLKLHFATPENKLIYLSLVLNELQTDFEKSNQPLNHFWHNKSIIEDAFENGHAIIVCNEEKQAIGWMIWSLYEGGAEIDIVEVKKEHCRKGIFTQMLSALIEKFPHLVVLSAQVLPQARPVFERLGWNAIPTRYGVTFYKTLRACLFPLQDLPDGFAIAVCPEDYYQVQRAPHDYLTKKSYFKIDVDAMGKLAVPIVMACGREGYIGLYMNKHLIKEGKPKHFEGTVSAHSGFVIISHIASELLIECHKPPVILKRSKEEHADPPTESSVKKSKVILNVEEKACVACLPLGEKFLTLQNSSSLWQPRQLPMSDTTPSAEEVSIKNASDVEKVTSMSL